MYLLFLAIIIILLLICLQEHRKTESQKKELLYICRKIETMIQEDANEFIMVPTENEVVKKVASTFNHLLETYYKRQSETRRYQRTIMQVLTNVSHDLKTALTVLKGYTEILKVKAQEAPVEEDVKK